MTDGIKKGRRAYLDDFKKNENGEYEYRGKRYSYRGTDLSRKKKTLAAASAAMAAAMIVSGCLPGVPGLGHCAYVLAPYMAGLCFALGAVGAVCRFYFAEYPLREYIYEASVKKVPLRCAVAAVAAVLSICGELVYVLQNGFEGRAPGFAVFLVLESAAAALAAVIWRSIQKIQWDVSA